MHNVNQSVGKESKCVEATGWLWDGLEHSCFVRLQFFNLFLSVGKTKIPSIYHHRFISDSLVPNGWVYETFGISRFFTIKPLQSLLNVRTLNIAFSAKCFIYRVTNWPFLSVYYLTFLLHLSMFGCWSGMDFQALPANLGCVMAYEVCGKSLKVKGWCT